MSSTSRNESFYQVSGRKTAHFFNTMSKNFFLIPGFRTQISDNMYIWLFDFLKKNNYKVIAVPVEWSRSTITQNAKDFIEYFEKYKSTENYILGFSYGAVIALITAEITSPKKMYLCSLSPDFSEDSQSMPLDMKKYIGKKRFLDTKTRSAEFLAKQLNIETAIFYGEKEALDYPPLKTRAEITAKLAKNTKLHIVKNSPHKIDFPEYINVLKKELIK